MGVGLYGADAVFTPTMDEFFRAYGPAGPTLREAWLSPSPGPLFDDCAQAQPLLFAVGAALGKAVLARGVAVGALLGHSVGELAAAAVAGVFSVPDGARILLARTAAMARTEPGGMLAVAGAADDLRRDLPPGVVVGAVNSTRQTVLSGPAGPLGEVAASLAARGLACNFVKARQAFHSPGCAIAATEFARVFTEVELRPPEIPIYSTHTGALVTTEQAASPTFWAHQLASPVLFWDAARELLATGPMTLLEAGASGSLASLLRRHPDIRSGRSRVLPLLPPIAGPDPVAVFEGSLSRVAPTVDHAGSRPVVSAI